jgi:hypothetical protein
VNSFTVWYILSIVTPQGPTLANDLMIFGTLEDCQHAARREVAAAPAGTLRWRCHEMTVTFTSEKGEVLVAFPQN